MADNIQCTNCEYKGLVSTGEEICPKCKEEGTLAWREGKPREVEDQRDYKTLLDQDCN